MKLKFKKRNIKECIRRFEERGNDFFNEAHRNYERRIIEKCNALEEWHEKFAWYPVSVGNFDDEVQEWAWLEKVTQRYSVNTSRSSFLSRPVINKFAVERYTSKDYFKKRLQGEIDGKNTSGVDGDFQNMTHDGTDTIMTTQGPMTTYEVRKKIREIISADDDSSKWG